MATAKVNLLRDELLPGGWVKAGIVEMDAEAARRLPAGACEILSVDGVEEVFTPCCGHATEADQAPE